MHAGAPVTALLALALGLSCASGGAPSAPLAPGPPPPRPAPPPPPAAAVVPLDAPRASCAPADGRPPVPAASDGEAPVPPIVDATGEVMAPFYRKLAALERGDASDHVRIAVYGDSNMTMDFITGRMRRVLHARYGDAGHGFVALGRPWRHYRHMDVQHDVGSGFVSYAVTTHPTGDGRYGIGGIAAENEMMGAVTWVATAGADAPTGRTVSRFDVFFLKRPSGGSFEVRVDGETRATVDTAAPEPSLGVHRGAVPDGPHRIELVASSPRRVRLFGVALERDAPGIVIDSLGVSALNTRAQSKEDPALNRAMLERRGYDLIVFMTGANDVFTLEETPAHLKELIELQRAALPGVPILIVSPADRGEKRTFAPTLRVVEQRRQVAAEQRAAFWDLWEAMGGQGSMARFRARGLAFSDHVHFTEAGGAWVGDRLLSALWRGLHAHVREHGGGCDARAPSP